MNIKSIEVKDDFLLLITNKYDEVGLFDVKPYLKAPVFLSLNSLDEFKKIHNGGYFVEWACGADLSADTIEAKWEKIR